MYLPPPTAPRAGSGDPHVQRIFYDPDDVVRLTGATGWQITVYFGAADLT